MIVTINTDAAFRADINKAAYSFWIAGGKTKLRNAAPLIGWVHNPSEAEIKAITQSLMVLHRTHLIENVKQINLHTDNTTAVSCIKYGRKNRNSHIEKAAKEARTWLWMVLERFHITQNEFTMMHVEGHSGIDSVVHNRNVWCDEAARKSMAEYIIQTNNKNKANGRDI